MDRRAFLHAALSPAAPTRARRRVELSERERAVHLLSRLAFGPRPGDVERLQARGTEAWLEEQLAGPADEELARKLAGFETLELSAAALLADYGEAVPAGLDPQERRRRERNRRLPRNELVRAVALRAIFARGQLHEVLADFWRNHFNVSYTKTGSAFQLLSDWDRTVIRAHALGSFGELLRASAHHPAMLHYLDNASSRRPPTSQELGVIERRVRRETGSREAGKEAADLALQRGLNENYARELLELHTLGVDRFYEQDDIVALAEILTGWTWSRGGEDLGSFRFRQDMHVAGSKRFLGQRIQGEPEKGKQEGDEVLALLAEHRGTSEFVAEKLVRHFVSDDPPPRLVARVAQTFRKTDGDVPAMLRTIVGSEEFWAPQAFRAKFKTPQEFVFSALRATAAEVTSWNEVLARLVAMNQPIYHCDDPTGWYDQAEAWLDPGVMALRWKFALDLAYGRLEGVRVPDEAFAEVSDEVPFGAWPDRMVARFVPAGIGNRTWRVLARTLADDPEAPPDELRRRLLGLLIGCPEFQWQ